MNALLNYKETDLLFFDIETVRAVEKLTPEHPLHDVWLYKTRKDEGDPIASFEDKAPLFAPFSKVACIVAGRIEDNTIKMKPYTNPDEKQLLKLFAEDIDRVTSAKPKTVLAGFNIKLFDIPYLCRRMVVNDIPIPKLLDVAGMKPWEVSLVDIGDLWKGIGFYPDSLASVAVACGMSSPKTVLDGSMVSDAYFSGKIEDIVQYCTGDVLTTANIYRKMMRKPLLK